MSEIRPSTQPNPKRAILRCDGNLETGFRVILEIRDRTQGSISEAIGDLPAAPDLLAALAQWRQSYRQSLSRGIARISLENVTVETGSLQQLSDCRAVSKTLANHLTDWLSGAGFQSIEQRLRESFMPQDEVEVLLRSDDTRLYQLPWHHWGFIERYPKAELLLSTPSAQLSTEVIPHEKVRILAILGDRRGIDTDTDRQILEKIPNAEVMFLVEPSRQFLYRYLWEQPWDILFFAGHSRTEAQQGILNINPNDQLSLEDLKYGLRKAIARGLKLAIFNSCDGLGLASELAQLHIPQLIVMREPVPDRVAQEFLKRFLQGFSSGDTITNAVRQAREWLQSLEADFPCASWLPLLCQNPAMSSLTWRSLTEPEPITPPVTPPKERRSRVKLRLRGVITMALAVSLMLSCIRAFGGLQHGEMVAYDRVAQFAYNTTSSNISDRIKLRVIGVTDEDLRNYGVNNRLTDRALTELITKINQYNPRVIGLDIFRDQPQPPGDQANHQLLLKALSNTSNLVTACQIGEDDQTAQQAIPSIAAPNLSIPKPIGYADALLPDDDNTVRRYLLQTTPREGADCNTEQSFAWQVAQQLAPQLPQWAEKHQQIVSQDLGGYQGDTELFGDNQLLINYHPSSRRIRHYSLQDILYLGNATELKQLFDDSVVLIGYESGTDDQHMTPIGPQRGVMIHAHALRQLLQETPKIRSWPQWVEYLSIFVMAAIGGLLIWRIRNYRQRVMAILILSFMLLLMAYLAYLQAVWIAILPILLVFWSTIGLIWGLESRLRHPAIVNNS